MKLSFLDYRVFLSAETVDPGFNFPFDFPDTWWGSNTGSYAYDGNRETHETVSSGTQYIVHREYNLLFTSYSHVFARLTLRFKFCS